MFRAFNSFQTGGLTAAAGTAITCLIPPYNANSYTVLTRVMYRCAGTAHAIVYMKALGVTTLAADAAASATSVTLSADPGTGTPSGNIATGDWVCIQLNDGSYFLATVTVSGLVMTVAALPAAASSGNKVWTFGVPGDHPVGTQTNPKPNAIKGYTITATVSVMNDWADYAAGLLRSLTKNSPLMLHSANGTAAGTFELVSAVHTNN